MTDAGLRRVVRCLSCSLNQFETANGHCRRCGSSLPQKIVLRPAAKAKPKPEVWKPKLDAHGQPGLSAFDFGAVGRRVRGLRVLRGLTQQQLADSVRQPRTYISRIENNRLLSGVAVLLSLRDALGTSLDYLILGEETSPSTGGSSATIGSALAELRRTQFLSQDNVQKQTGIPRAQLSKAENGHGIPNLRQLMRIHKALNFSFDSLVGSTPL